MDEMQLNFGKDLKFEIVILSTHISLNLTYKWLRGWICSNITLRLSSAIVHQFKKADAWDIFYLPCDQLKSKSEKIDLKKLCLVNLFSHWFAPASANGKIGLALAWADILLVSFLYGNIKK